MLMSIEKAKSEPASPKADSWKGGLVIGISVR
jgi:hypothetical protein